MPYNLRLPQDETEEVDAGLSDTFGRSSTVAVAPLPEPSPFRWNIDDDDMSNIIDVPLPSPTVSQMSRRSKSRSPMPPSAHFSPTPLRTSAIEVQHATPSRLSSRMTPIPSTDRSTPRGFRAPPTPYATALLTSEAGAPSSLRSQRVVEQDAEEQREEEGTAETRQETPASTPARARAVDVSIAISSPPRAQWSDVFEQRHIGDDSLFGNVPRSEPDPTPDFGDQTEDYMDAGDYQAYDRDDSPSPGPIPSMYSSPDVRTAMQHEESLTEQVQEADEDATISYVGDDETQDAIDVPSDEDDSDHDAALSAHGEESQDPALLNDSDQADAPMTSGDRFTNDLEEPDSNVGIEQRSELVPILEGPEDSFEDYNNGEENEQRDELAAAPKSEKAGQVNLHSPADKTEGQPHADILSSGAAEDSADEDRVADGESRLAHEQQADEQDFSVNPDTAKSIKSPESDSRGPSSWTVASQHREQEESVLEDEQAKRVTSSASIESSQTVTESSSSMFPGSCVIRVVPVIVKVEPEDEAIPEPAPPSESGSAHWQQVDDHEDEEAVDQSMALESSPARPMPTTSRHSTPSRSRMTPAPSPLAVSSLRATPQSVASRAGHAATSPQRTPLQAIGRHHSLAATDSAIELQPNETEETEDVEGDLEDVRLLSRSPGVEAEPATPERRSSISSRHESSTREHQGRSLAEELDDGASSPATRMATPARTPRGPRMSKEILAPDDPEHQSVVEISSFDPRAAARAAALLKMNYDYIEYGLEGSSRTNQGRRASRLSRSNGDMSHISLPEMLHEAELELVDDRDDRSSRMDSEAPTEIIHATPHVPGFFPKTPMRFKIDFEDWSVSDWRDLERSYRRVRRRVETQSGNLADSTIPVSTDQVIGHFLQKKGLAEEDLMGQWQM